MHRLLVSTTFGCLTLAGPVAGDALTLLHDKDAQDGGPGMEAVDESPWYAFGAVGGNFVLDGKVRDTDVKYVFGPGVAVSAGVGYRLQDGLSLEFRSGVMYNSVKRLEGTANTSLGSVSISDGGGHLYQVPFMASLAYTVPLNDKTHIGFKGGLGVQWTEIKTDSYVATLGGASTSVSSSRETSMPFRWEVGFQLGREISDHVRIGGGLMFGGATKVKTGQTFSSGSNELKDLLTFSLGFGVIVEF